MIPKNIIDEIIETARIEEVIGDFVNLKKSGSNYKGLSPFTEEKTPSFMVSPAKQIFKCFSSGKGGNVVSFVMEHEHFSYPEALRYLAQKYNIEIPEERPLTADEIEAKNERESLLLINDFANQFFQEKLHQSDEGKAIGLSYFKERGFDQKMIELFQLGYNPSKGESFTEVALEKGYKEQYLLSTGLTKKKDDRTFDFFRGRVMFPIHSVSGKILGFGGRTLRNDKKTAKYFNSPESIIYNKSKVLYGIYFAKSAIIKQDNCYLVEGYTDVISLFQNGVENVVSSSGTALTKEQIRLIHRYTENVTILYDGDDAGIRASFRGIDMLLEAGLKIKVILFPEGEDPDSYASKVSQSKLETYLKEEAKDFLVFKSEILLKDANNDPLKKAELIKELVTSIAKIPDQIERTIYVRECATRFDMPEQTLMNEVNRKRRGQSNERQPRDQNQEVQTQPQPKQKETSSDDQLLHHERDVVRLLIHYGTLEMEVEQTDDDGKSEKISISVIEYILSILEANEIQLTHEVYNKIVKEYEEGLLQNYLYDEKHFINHPELEISRMAAELVTSEHQLSQHWSTKHHIYTETEEDRLEMAVKGSMLSLQLATVKKQISDIQNELKSSDTDGEKVIQLLQEQQALLRAKKILSEQLGRIIVQ